MIVHDTVVAGARLLEPAKIGDSRGFFARVWDGAELSTAGLVTDIAQANVSRTARRGTIRGLHFQRPPSAEDKLVRCTRGALWDVIADLRSDSPTYGRTFGVELTDENHLALYIPKGCAHGFQTLSDDVEAFYFVSARYAPEQEGGVRFDDPALEIEWPLAPTVVSDKDLSWPPLDLERVP